MNPITKEAMTNLQNTVKRRRIIVFSKYFAALIIRATFWSSYREICPELHCDPKYGQYAKHSDRPFIHRFPLVYLCVHVSNILESLLWNVYLTKLWLIRWPVWKILSHASESFVLFYSYGAYHQNDTLELLPWNCDLTPLWRKRWPICKILSHASESSFSFSYLVLIMWATLRAVIVRFLLNSFTAQKMTICKTMSDHRVQRSFVWINELPI